MTSLTSTRSLATGAAVWTGEAFKDDSSWILHLDRVQLDEIEKALPQWLAVGMEHIDRPLVERSVPSLRVVAQAVRLELTKGRGFCLVRKIPVERFGEDGSALILWALGELIGCGVTQNPACELVCKVTDRGDQAYGDKDVRAYETKSRLPYHGDNADIVGLLCIRKAKVGGESYIASARAIHNEILQRRPDLLEHLYQLYPHDRRQQQAVGEPGTTRPIPIFKQVGGQVACRYLPGLIRAHAQRTGTQLDPKQIEAIEYFDEIARSPRMRLEMLLEPGDVQYLNNYLVMHSRNEFREEPGAMRTRLMLRSWLMMDDAIAFSEADDAFRYDLIRFGNQGLSGREFHEARDAGKLRRICKELAQ